MPSIRCTADEPKKEHRRVRGHSSNLLGDSVQLGRSACVFEETEENIARPIVGIEE